MLALSSLTWAHKKLPYPETLSGHDAVKLKALYLARPSARILTPLLPGLYIVASSSVLKPEVYLFLLVVLQLLLLLLLFFWLLPQFESCSCKYLLLKSERLLLHRC